ncbi:unnamed protein product [Didymodactylos carnosus]|uniref:Uncharacterized protein n=1 Tax=Didymodactylos carnosus TaxID=1234261 RepID=A0A816A7I5_9BILA|nr:unnamed protein product [Didymodactylos carnosus]CAF1594375.1 unnamed protein product [Didymodactylos carnosus]CAF4344724.1 unnamed protein product [Didymodactylos carnosus]CAF4468039.1 unnamed protein product [Didymodactylos carnosus]
MSIITTNNNELIDDIFTCPSDEFYKYVRQQCGEDIEQLLKTQSIRSAPHLIKMPVDKILKILTCDSVQLQNLCCLKCKGGYEVKIGVEYALIALKNELKEKYEKRSKKPRYRSIKPLAVTTLTSTTTTALPLSQSRTTSTTTVPIQRTPQSSINTKKNKVLNENGHRAFLTEQVNKWCSKNKNVKLNENVDYRIIIKPIIDENNEPMKDMYTCSMKCSCGSQFKLGVQNERFKLSMFYRHLENSQCQIIKEKLDKENQRKKQQQSSKASTNQIPKIPLKNVSTNAQIPSTMATTMDGSGGVIKPNKITGKLAPKRSTDNPDGNVDRSLKQLRIVSSTQSSFKVIPRPINIQQQSKQ